MSFITEAAPEAMETPAELQHFIISKPLVCPCPDSHPHHRTQCLTAVSRSSWNISMSSSFPNKSFLSGEFCRIPTKAQSDFWHLGWVPGGSRCRTTAHTPGELGVQGPAQAPWAASCPQPSLVSCSPRAATLISHPGHPQPHLSL